MLQQPMTQKSAAAHQPAASCISDQNVPRIGERSKEEAACHARARYRGGFAMRLKLCYDRVGYLD